MLRLVHSKFSLLSKGISGWAVWVSSASSWCGDASCQETFSSAVLFSGQNCNSQLIFKQKIWNLYNMVQMLVHNSYILLLLARSLVNWILFIFCFRQCQLPVNYVNQFIGLLLLKPLIMNKCYFSWLMWNGMWRKSCHNTIYM